MIPMITNGMTYDEFLHSKMAIAEKSGFEVTDSEIHPALKPHQRAAVRWALEGGRRALFESFGLGKTIQELEWCRQVIKHKGGKALIVLPLGVKQEFTRDAVELLQMEPPTYVRTMAEAKAAETTIVMTNYERVRDGDINPKYFTGTSLDEASVLRSFGSKTYQTFLDKFKGVPYKLVSTATPSPNKLNPFGGLMTVPMMAVKMGRYGIGIELNPDYFRDGLGYLKQEELIRDEPTLFDFIG